MEIESLDPDISLWESLSRKQGGGLDLIVASRARIPDPAAITVRALRSLPDAPEVIVLSEREDAEEQARMTAAGCAAVLAASLSERGLREVLVAVLEQRRRLASMELSARQGARADRLRLEGGVGASPAMLAFLEMARRVAPTDVSLLILGETGVGKEWLARAIHAASPRASGPFVPVNCGALSESLLESELFGHEEGAFTGAARMRRGWFEVAHRGTIFLDEIGDMPSHLQVKLLRVLQEREIQRVGGERSIPVDVRVMAATNRELSALRESPSFRRDLYYRLGAVTLPIPPLRARREEIPGLVHDCIRRDGARLRRAVTGIEPDALAALVEYPWPGNVRELQNVIERAVLLAGGARIALADLPESIARRPATAPAWVAGVPLPAEEARNLASRPLREVRRRVVEALERAYLGDLLRAHDGRVGRTAAAAGIRARSLFDKMRRLGLRKEQFRPPRG